MPAAFEVKNALLIQTAFIGDVVLTTPMIAAFKRYRPEAKLTVMVKPEAVSLLRNNPHVDDLLIIDKKGKHQGAAGMFRMIGEIRSRNFDLLLSPHKSHRTGFLAMFSKIPRRFGYRDAGWARFAYTKHLTRPMDLPEIERLLQFLEDALGENTQLFPRDLELYVNDEAREQARDILSQLDASHPVLVAPSSVWPTKRWTPWNFAELIGLLLERYKKPVLLVGSPGDREVADRVLEFLKLAHPDWPDRRVHNICGKTSLPALYALMEKSLLLVSNDSAPVHFGCAAKIPVVAIFGPTVPALGYAPIAPRTAVAELADLGCRPCGLHGAKRCPQSHFRCMKDLTPAMVMDVVEKVNR